MAAVDEVVAAVDEIVADDYGVVDAVVAVVAVVAAVVAVVVGDGVVVADVDVGEDVAEDVDRGSFLAAAAAAGTVDELGPDLDHDHASAGREGGC